MGLKEMFTVLGVMSASLVVGCGTHGVNGEENLSTIQQETTLACMYAIPDVTHWSPEWDQAGIDSVVSTLTTNNYDHSPYAENCDDTFFVSWKDIYETAMEEECNSVCLFYNAEDWTAATNQADCESRHLDIALVAYGMDHPTECVGEWDSQTSECALDCTGSTYQTIWNAEDHAVIVRHNFLYDYAAGGGISAYKKYTNPYTWYLWSKGRVTLYCSPADDCV